MSPQIKSLRKNSRYWISWIIVRPRRWFFWQMVAKGSFKPRWFPERDDVDISDPHKGWGLGGILWPNIHWWVLYNTVFNFFHWLEWGDSSRRYRLINGLCCHKWWSKILRRIGETTAGGAISCYECWHCAHPDGNPVDLSEEEGETFILEREWQSSTQDGTDYRFCGITICPRCGFKDYYEDGSL